jgi:hypothetical protein
VKHVLFGSKSVFLGDTAAETLLDYAAHVARIRTGDRVDLRGYSDEGSEMTVSLVLDPGVVLAAETTDLPFADRDNDDAIAYMRERMQDYELSPDHFFGQELDA